VNGFAMRFTTNIIKILIKLFLLLLSVSSITSLSSLVYTRNKISFLVQGFGFYPINYFKAVYETFFNLFSIWDSKFPYYFMEYDVFPYIIDKYIYTMSILFSALIITIFISFFLAYAFFFLPLRFKKILKSILVVLDSIPDIIIILASQMLIIRIFQETGIKIIRLYGTGGNVYFLPIICLSFVPIIMVIKIMLKIFDEEIQQQYVEFAIAKGLSRSTVFIKHVVRNVIKSLFSHVSLIYWYMLSSLFVIEYLFQMQGFTLLIYRVNDTSLSSVAIIMILIPFGLIKAASFKMVERRAVND
jgi:peptide/nickel transport system permease protein